jgi:hypothetical protein
MPRARQREDHEATETDLLLPLRGDPKKRTFATVDIEARNWVDAYAVDFYDGETHVTFESPRHVDGRLLGASSKNRAGQLRRGYERGRKVRVRTAVDCRLNFLRWLVETGDKYTGYWIYAHNGGNYDFLFFFRKLIKEMARLGFETDILPVGSCALKLTIIDPERDEYGEPIREAKLDGNGIPVLDEGGKPLLLTKPKRKWTLLDSARLIPMALDKIGETFGIGRKVVLAPELGLSVDTPTKTLYRMLSMPKHAATMRKYLHMDTELLYLALHEFQRRVNKLGGQVGITLASTALDVWRRGGYMGSERIHRNWHLSDCPDRERAPEEAECQGCGIEYARGMLRGGRTEIWTMNFEQRQKSDGYLNYVDVNSHYSHCMLEPMPIGEAIVIDGGTPESVEKNARTRTGFIDCEVYVPEDCYLPPLPFRMGGKLMFPTGRFRAKWDTCELEALGEVGGRIEKVHRQVWYDTAPIFSEFIVRLFQYNDKNSKTYEAGMAAISKLVRNSTFGKLGIREMRERIWVSPSGRVPNFTEFFDMGSDTYIKKESYRAPYLAPAIPAHITSLARVRLWHYALRVLRAGGRIFYCDTDSLIFWLPFIGMVQVHARDVLPLSGRLGDLKLEHDKIRAASLTLPKLYTFDCESPEKGDRPPLPSDCLCYRDWYEKDRKTGIPWCSHEIRAKGVGGGLDSDDITIEEYRRFTDLSLPESERTLIRYRMAKLKESRREFLRKTRDFPFVVKQPKAIRTAYDKRIIQAGGIETRPIVLRGAVELVDDASSELQGLAF